MKQRIDVMATEEGIVENISNHHAFVRVRKNAHCARCSTKGACQTLNDKEIRIEVENDLKAQVGDHVEISVPARSLVKLSIVVYLIPILALVAGAILGSLWADARGAEPSVPSILGGAVGMGAALYVVKKFDRSIHSKRQYQPRLTKILPQNASPDPTP